MSESNAAVEVRVYQAEDETAVVDLWRRCNLVGWCDPHLAIERKQQFQPELFLVGTLDGEVVATVMAGYDGHRGWIYSVGVCPDVRRRGIGRQMMEEAEARLRALGCLKINLQVRCSNTAVAGFYRRLGFSDDDVLSFGKRLG